MGSRQPAVSAGRGEGDCLAVLPPPRCPARASALARTASGSRGVGRQDVMPGGARAGPCAGGYGSAALFLISPVSHPFRVAYGGQPGPVGPAPWGTVRIAACVRRHPKVSAGWNIAARRGRHPKVLPAGWGRYQGSGRAAGPARRPRCGWRLGQARRRHGACLAAGVHERGSLPRRAVLQRTSIASDSEPAVLSLATGDDRFWQPLADAALPVGARRRSLIASR